MPSTFQTSQVQLNKVQQTYLRDLQTNWKLKLFFLNKLPSLLWWSGRIEEASPQRVVASIPYNWRTQNPYNSTYFAAQSGIGELSTGMLVTLATKGYDTKISMLVIDFQAQFTKKATDRVYYTCDMGDQIFATVAEAVATGEARTIECLAIGKMTNGVEVGRVKVTWSVKPKKK
ncbi:MAG: DUF4442 domain-containing protein [Bacteroidota bacterium]